MKEAVLIENQKDTVLPKYSHDEVYKQTLNYFSGDTLATEVWINKYCLKDSEGNYYEKTPDDMHWRLAKEFARIESKYPNPLSKEKIFEKLKKFKKIVPQGSPMAGIGNDFQVVSLGNCFVIGNDSDSYGSVLKTDEEQIQLMKRRGGVGHDLSHIRPSGSYVNNTAMTSTGIVPFMERYSNSTREVAQCLDESTLILTKKGLTKIKNIKNGDYVWTENEWVLVADVIKNKKKTYKIKTKFGNEIIASSDHVFHTIKGEKKLKEFNVGDEITMIWGNGYDDKKYIKLKKPDYSNSGNRLVKHNLPENLDENFGYLLGYMYGDGGFHKKISKTTKNTIGMEISLACSLDRPEIINKLKNIWYELFDCKLKTKENDGNWITLIKSSQQIYKFMLHNDIAKEKAGSLKFPEKILNSPISVQIAFISGYFDADGYASDKKKGYVFNSVDKDFLLNIKYILSSVGILSKLHVEDRSKLNWKNIYSLCVVGASSKIKFKELFNKDSLKLNKSTLSANRDCFLSIYKSKDVLVENYNKYSYVPDNSQYLSINVLRRLNEDNIGVKNSNPVLYQDFIDEISEYEEESNVYDLVLIDTHLFWANGFYVHNSGRRGALMLSIDVKHLESENFIDAKLEKGKVTGANISIKLGDDFMNAVINNTSFKTQYPINTTNPIYEKEINANKLWKKIIHNTWKSAEPGILFFDNILNESIPSCYGKDWIEISTNPCVVGNTFVAVADGRDKITIKQLAEEGKDVPIYAYDDKGNIVIRTMRNPRISGFNKKIYKITLENGHELKVTGNHKIRLKSGKYVEAKNLKYGDSVEIMTKYDASIKDIFSKSNNNSQDYIWVSGGIKKGTVSEHKLIAEFNNNHKLKKGEVVHHIDYNAKNNKPENLKIMTKKDHDILHSKNMLGNNNPYYRMNDEWKKKFSESKGELNGRYSGYTKEDIQNAALKLTKALNRRFSIKEWQKHAKKFGLPVGFSDWRKKQLNGGILGLSKWAAKECGLIEHINHDPRLVKTYNKMLDMGYDCSIEENQVIITKECECDDCNAKIKVRHDKREISYCSISCHNKMMHKNLNIKTKINNTRKKTEEKRKEKIAEQQIKIISDLKFKLGKMPMRKEWESECKNNNISFELGRKSSPIRNWDKLKEMAFNYNHKVISIQEDGYENVYNGTVDDFHNFFVGGFEEKNKNNKRKCLYINNLQCGELPLPPYDSCRLLAINLFGYVINPFTKNAYFDKNSFIEDTIIAERLMDDIVDLELEKIDKILTKIKADPEPDYIKETEFNLWINIKKKTELGRRTGLGVTGEGDMLAALGLTYGTDKANVFAEEVHKNLKLSAYRSSVTMAKERGAFPIFDANREMNNPFIQRIKNEELNLWNDMQKYGRRNIALLTIAPTGSVSILTQTTSGIECVFLPYYKRRRKINPNDKNVRVDFTDEQGDTWMEYPVFHHNFELWLKINGYNINEIKENFTIDEIDEIVKISPYFKATSNDVNWVKKVEMQGMIQKHVDHSISVTVNLPKEATEEIVSKVYETGWRSGCKGITVYRDGSRDGVLITDKKKKVEKEEQLFKDNHAPKRPKRLKADIVRFQNNLEKWVAVVGKLDNRPYEIFTGKYVNGISELPANIDECEVIKIKDENGNKRYDIEYVNNNGEKIILKGISEKFNPEYWNYAKMISSVMRHGMPLPYVLELIQSLNLQDDHLNTWKNGVTRVIKRYIKEGKAKGVCPNCGSESLEYVEGCLTCKGCGSGNCG